MFWGRGGILRQVHFWNHDYRLLHSWNPSAHGRDSVLSSLYSIWIVLWSSLHLPRYVCHCSWWVVASSAVFLRSIVLFFTFVKVLKQRGAKASLDWRGSPFPFDYAPQIWGRVRIRKPKSLHCDAPCDHLVCSVPSSVATRVSFGGEADPQWHGHRLDTCLCFQELVWILQDPTEVHIFIGFALFANSCYSSGELYHIFDSESKSKRYT